MERYEGLLWISGTNDIQESRKTIRLAFKRGLIADWEVGWIWYRIQSSHTYNEEVVAEVTGDITVYLSNLTNKWIINEYRICSWQTNDTPDTKCISGMFEYRRGHFVWFKGEGKLQEKLWYRYYVQRELLKKVCRKLADLLLPYTFDVSLFDQINNPFLLNHINRAGKLFYSRSARNIRA